MIYYILLLHWIADFVFQTDKMAKNKSSSWTWLLHHVTTYNLVLVVGMVLGSMFTTFVLGHPWPKWVIVFCLLNSTLHFGIDAVTSRITSRLWAMNETHSFFVVIGLDQLLHVSILIATMGILKWV